MRVCVLLLLLVACRPAPVVLTPAVVLGVDADHDDVRDDVAADLAARYSGATLRAAMQHAQSVQFLLAGAVGAPWSSEPGIGGSLICLERAAGVRNAKLISDHVEALTVNTHDRHVAYDRANHGVPGGSTGGSDTPRCGED